MCAAARRQRSGAGDDEHEGDRADDPERAARKRLAVDRQPGGDRKRVRQKRRDADGRKRSATLERKLQRREREPVRCEDGRHEHERGSSVHGRLRGDVARGVEDACGDSEARAWSQQVRCRPGCGRGDGARSCQPSRDRGR